MVIIRHVPGKQIRLILNKIRFTKQELFIMIYIDFIRYTDIDEISKIVAYFSIRIHYSQVQGHFSRIKIETLLNSHLFLSII